MKSLGALNDKAQYCERSQVSDAFAASLHVDQYLTPEGVHEEGHICWSSALKQVPSCFHPTQDCMLPPSASLIVPFWEGWGPPGWQCFCPSPQCHLRVPQYTLGFCCLQKHTENERVAVPTPQWQTQERVPMQMSPLSPDILF